MDNHTRFQNHLKASLPAVQFFADLLRSRGMCDVHVPQTHIAPEHKDWRAYRDSGDIICNGKRLEIKALSYPFTGHGDWPFDDYFVCAQHSFDESEQKPDYYISLNPPWTHFGVVKVAQTREHWTTRWTRDRRYDTRSHAGQWRYVMPTAYVKFYTIKGR